MCILYLIEVVLYLTQVVRSYSEKLTLQLTSATSHPQLESDTHLMTTELDDQGQNHAADNDSSTNSQQHNESPETPQVDVYFDDEEKEYRTRRIDVENQEERDASMATKKSSGKSNRRRRAGARSHSIPPESQESPEFILCDAQNMPLQVRQLRWQQMNEERKSKLNLLVLPRYGLELA